MYNSLVQLAERYKIVLGSGSPRRLKLLTETGIPFRQLIPKIDEFQREGEVPDQFALRLAREKAQSLQSQIDETELIIGCDTIVILESLVLGKPKDENDALTMLTALSGKRHDVITSIAICDQEKVLVEGYDQTGVFFHAPSKEQIMQYIAGGEPMDKAGAYGIQGIGSFLVDRIEGNLDNVIGFPQGLLNQLAEKILKLGL